jgi:hypothetical protein
VILHRAAVLAGLYTMPGAVPGVVAVAGTSRPPPPSSATLVALLRRTATSSAATRRV